MRSLPYIEHDLKVTLSVLSKAVEIIGSDCLTDEGKQKIKALNGLQFIATFSEDEKDFIDALDRTYYEQFDDETRKLMKRYVNHNYLKEGEKI